MFYRLCAAFESRERASTGSTGTFSNLEEPARKSQHITRSYLLTIEKMSDLVGGV